MIFLRFRYSFLQKNMVLCVAEKRWYGMSESKETIGSLAVSPASRFITIPAATQGQARKLRVAAYARVSSDSDDQLHSYAAQNAYFTKLIISNPDWDFVDVYADKGITGTAVAKREDFKRMLEDARKGRIDRILVKSISRFARNTKDGLEAVRELKSLGVSVYFEEQNIDTARATGETLTAVFAALAQKESEAISERARRSYEMRMQRGTFSTNTAPFGYRLVNGHLEIDDDEAKIIRAIFDACLAGKSIIDIAREIACTEMATGMRTMKWQESTILYILHNEKYEGNSLTQKTCTSKELSRRKRRNTGEKRQILVTDDHTGIVSHEVFAKVQELLKRKRTAEPKKEGKDVPFKGKIVCGVCGASLRRKPVRGKMYWLCRTHEQAAADCPIKQVPEIEIEQAFLRLYFKLQHGGMNILTQLLQDIQEARSNRLLWSEDMVAINKQISDISGQERLLSQLRQQGAVDPDIFISRSNQLSEMRREAKQKKSRILRSEEDQTIQKTQEMMDILESGPDMLDALDEELFSELVERIVVESNNRICFQLINGMGATESIERIKR